MSRRKSTASTGTMLELWRPPQHAGEPVGCLATTYTFAPGLFDEQCLARFLDIESEPNREDLAFLLERESRLGGVYAGVLVDHTQAGVEHSLRWDVLPVRIPRASQHAKLSLLAWSHRVRVIVASANLTEPGYRYNFEVAGTVDLSPDEADPEILADTVTFLRRLLGMVPGAALIPPEIQRAEAFLAQVEALVRGWKPRKRAQTMRQRLVVTLPPSAPGQDDGVSALDTAIETCRKRGRSPGCAWVASPFFDVNDDYSRVVAAMCKQLARSKEREVRFCVPALQDEQKRAVPRLAAPKSLWLTPQRYSCDVSIHALPQRDPDKNPRSWHAKMLALDGDDYASVMVGSSNFTSPGMGVGERRNAEANLLTTVDHVDYAKERGRLVAVWPETEEVEDPEAAEWLGAQPDVDEETQADMLPPPPGFLSAMFRAGDERKVILRLDAGGLPKEWFIRSCGHDDREILSSVAWVEAGKLDIVELDWAPVQPPDRLLVRWEEKEAFMPLNVEDGSELPPPEKLKNMSADDMLWVLAAADPSAAFRLWAKRQRPGGVFDDEVDSATPIDLDPLRRHDIHATFLHRIRRRARIMAQLRANMQRPVWGRQALEWRLRGLVGIEPLAERMVDEFARADGHSEEALLTLADFLIVLREVDYEPHDGALPKTEFEKTYRPFLVELAGKMRGAIEPHRGRMSAETSEFWDRVVKRCQS